MHSGQRGALSQTVPELVWGQLQPWKSSRNLCTLPDQPGDNPSESRRPSPQRNRPHIVASPHLRDPFHNQRSAEIGIFPPPTLLSLAEGSPGHRWAARCPLSLFSILSPLRGAHGPPHRGAAPSKYLCVNHPAGAEPQLLPAHPVHLRACPGANAHTHQGCLQLSRRGKH